MKKKIFKILFLLLLVFVAFKVYQTRQDVKQVLTYRQLVRQVLAEEDTKANEELVLAMIYTETKGKSADLMQSSEVAYGEKDVILDNKESIRQGVQALSENLALAKDKDVDVWTAVQAYNFGQAYIDYVAENGGENSLSLAKEYSRTVVAPSLGNKTGKTYYYLSPISIVDGAQLYVNGGNYYYSRLVSFHLKLIQFFDKF